MSLEDLTRSQLLLFDILLRVVQSDIGHTFASLSNKFLEEQIVSSCLHVVAISLNKTLDLLNVKVVVPIVIVTSSIFIGQLLNYFQVNGDWMKAHYNAAIILHIHLVVPLMFANIINLDALCWIGI